MRGMPGWHYPLRDIMERTDSHDRLRCGHSMIRHDGRAKQREGHWQRRCSHCALEESRCSKSGAQRRKAAA